MKRNNWDLEKTPRFENPVWLFCITAADAKATNVRKEFCLWMLIFSLEILKHSIVFNLWTTWSGAPPLCLCQTTCFQRLVWLSLELQLFSFFPPSSVTQLFFLIFWLKLALSIYLYLFLWFVWALTRIMPPSCLYFYPLCKEMYNFFFFCVNFHNDSLTWADFF